MRASTIPLFPLFLLLAACDDSKDEADADGDGVEAPADCDDNDASIKPGAVEACDGVDNDCDGDIDEGTGDLFYVDADGDGFGADGVPQVALCAAEPGYVTSAGDCDDNDSAVNPDATETCDAVDRNCDGQPTLGATDVTDWYIDRDMDGYGASEENGGVPPLQACEAPGANYVDNADDCNDLSATANPLGVEVCNGIDDDCNDLVDDSATDAQNLFVDSDGDGYGDINAPVSGCPSAGLVADETDCDDSDRDVNPGELDVCNGGVDDDCDPTTLEDEVFGISWYYDDDGDGRGDAEVVACDQPAGTVQTSGDCDDTDDTVYPGADEDCDPVDRDCDGSPDNDAVDAVTYYLDTDGDGYGTDISAIESCTAINNYVETGGDCDDLLDTVNPGAVERCNGDVDDDCDSSTTDDAAPDAPVWYVDADGDGYAGITTQVVACEQPPNTEPAAEDCDDLNALIYPGALEVCNGGVDDDCDSNTDEEVVNQLYQDADYDGFGDPNVSELGCTPSGALINAIPQGEDCDDTDPSINPYTTPDCTVEHCGQLTGNETWSASVSHRVTCDVDVQGPNNPVLVVEPGVVVEFEAGTELLVGDTTAGTLIIDAAAQPVLFTSAEPVPSNGDWDGVFISDKQSGSSIDGLIIEYAGGAGGSTSAGLSLDLGTTELEVQNLTSQRNAGDGIRVLSGEPWIHDTYLLDNDRNGLYVTANHGLERLATIEVASFTNNVVLGNAEYPVSIPGSHADEIFFSTGDFTTRTDTDGDLLPDDLEAVLGTNPNLADTDGDGIDDREDMGVNLFLDPANPNGIDRIELLSGTMRTTGTWRQHDLPYYASSNQLILVEDGPEAVLNIDPGILVYFDVGAEMFVGSGAQGALIVGDYPNPSPIGDEVRFAAEPDLVINNLNWDGLYIGPNGGDSLIAGLIVEGGGGNGRGNLWISSSDPSIAHSVFRDSDNAGIYVDGIGAGPRITNTDMSTNDTYGLFVASTSGIYREIVGASFFDNSFTDNGTTSVALPPNYVGELDSSSTFADPDQTKRVRIHGGSVLDDATWQKLDADYEVLGDISVSGPRDPILFVEPGNTFYMAGGSSVSAGGDGAMIIEAGPPEDRVTFTSSNPAPGPGDWGGLTIGDNGPLDSRLQSVLDGVNVEYASNPINVVGCFNSPTKGPLVISNVDIISSSTIGIDHGTGQLILDTVNVPLPLDGYCIAQPPSTGDSCSATLVSANDLTCPGVDLGTINEDSIGAIPDTVDFGFITFEGGTFETDVTLPGLTSSYRVVSDITVAGPTNPTLTIEDGATLYFDADVSINVGGFDDGTLVIEGTGSQLLPYDLNQWEGIVLNNNCTADIQGGLIDGGGGNGTGAIWVDGCETGSIGDVSFVNSFGTCDIYHEGPLEPGFDISGAVSAFVCAVP